MKFYVLTLGCPKNEVDSQGMARLLVEAGHAPVEEAREADVLVVNTCGFLEAAKEESIGELRALAEGRRTGQKLIAAGCLVERYADEVKARVPGLDDVIGTREWFRIGEVVNGGGPAQPPAATAEMLYPLPITPKHTAYLKIQDGCSRTCTFCIIPKIKGRYGSKPIETVIREAKALVRRGAKEIVLIAQDLPAYGYDWGKRDHLADLVAAICASVPELRWLRLMYAYPNGVTDRLIDVMASHPQVCHYLDLPLQHAHPDVLRRMRRPSNVERVRRTIEKLRAAMPDIAIRSGFIVGFPGETEAEFKELLTFVRSQQFDRVGVFTYSQEAGTAAAELPNQVPEELKQDRYRRLMTVLQGVSWNRNRAQVGRALDVLIEGEAAGKEGRRHPGGYSWAGRSYRDAPEVDGVVFCKGPGRVGEIVKVRITNALPYDLVGEIVGCLTP